MVLLHVFLLYVWGLRRSSKLFADDLQECLSLESDRGFGGTDCIPVSAGAGALIGGFLTNQHKISSNRVVALCLTFAA